MIMMSVDYGDARTGIAVCDKSEMLATPVTVIKETYMPKVAKQIAELALLKKAELVVVGCPINMDGSHGFRAEKCTELAELLKSEYSLEVKMWDERMTTMEAYKMLDAGEVYGQKRKDAIDAVAATIILEDFIKFRKNNK